MLPAANSNRIFSTTVRPSFAICSMPGMEGAEAEEEVQGRRAVKG